MERQIFPKDQIAGSSPAGDAKKSSVTGTKTFAKGLAMTKKKLRKQVKKLRALIKGAIWLHADLRYA